MPLVTRDTTDQPRLYSPPGYERVVRGMATEDIEAGELCVETDAGWSLCPAGALEGHALALKNYRANQDSCDFLTHGEMVNFVMTGIAAGADLFPSNYVAGGIASEIPDALAAVAEVQTLTITATGGTYTLEYEGQETAPIAYNANAATIELAFEALSTVGAGNGTVAGTGPFTFTGTGTLAGQDLSPIIVDPTALTGGTATIATTTPGRPARGGACRMRAGKNRNTGTVNIIRISAI